MHQEQDESIFRNITANVSACLFHIEDDSHWWGQTIATTITQSRGTPAGEAKAEVQHRPISSYDEGAGVTGTRHHGGMEGISKRGVCNKTLKWLY